MTTLHALPNKSRWLDSESQAERWGLSVPVRCHKTALMLHEKSDKALESPAHVKALMSLQQRQNGRKVIM